MCSNHAIKLHNTTKVCQMLFRITYSQTLPKPKDVSSPDFFWLI
jgi:hypothetical protein